MTDRQTAQPSPGTAAVFARATWRKSSFSGTQGNCVEVAASPAGLVAVRDSKHPLGSVLVVSAEEWRAFITAAQALPVQAPDGRRELHPRPLS
jgi:hypothetical protein